MSIDEHTSWWNVPLIREVFSKGEASLICGIPICPASRSQTDKLVWLGTSNGFFFVRSAYHLAKEKSISNRGMCSSLLIWIDYVTRFGILRVPLWLKCFYRRLVMIYYPLS
jgi:hypothetical protein